MKNDYYLSEGILYIVMSSGDVAKVNARNYSKVKNYRWRCLTKPNGKKYAITNVEVSEGKRKTLYLHRAILDKAKSEAIDHINNDGLDCRNNNLRECTLQQNNFNRGKTANNQSGYKGVTWRKDCKKWQSVIHINKKKKHLGYFDTIEHAYQAYVQACYATRGEFAHC